MPDKEKDSKKRSLFQGWASFFGKGKDAKDASQYLATRYYNSSELENINTKDSRYTLVDRWARDFSEKARRAVQGNPDVVDKDMPLPDVTWQDGKFKSYVKGNVMVEPDEDTVRHLKELSSSYHVELPKDLQKFINEQAMKSMCNTYWYDKANDNVLHVTGYNAYDFQTTSQERYNDRSGFTLVVDTLDNLGERIETDHTVSSKEIAALASEGKLKKMADNDISRYHSMCDIARKAASHYHDIYSYVKDIDGNTPIKGARIKFSLDEGSNYQFQATGFRVFMDSRPGSPSSYIRLYSDEMKKNGQPVGININRNNAHKYEGQLTKLRDYLLSDVEDIRKVASAIAACEKKNIEGIACYSLDMPFFGKAANQSITIDDKEYNRITIANNGTVRGLFDDGHKCYEKKFGPAERSSLLYDLHSRAYDLMAQNSAHNLSEDYMRGDGTGWEYIDYWPNLVMNDKAKALYSLLPHDMMVNSAFEKQLNVSVDFNKANKELVSMLTESIPEDGDHLEFSKPFAVVLNDKKVECTGIARTGYTAVLLPTVGYHPRPSVEEMLQDKIGIDICSLPTERRAAMCDFIQYELSRKEKEETSKQNIQNESLSQKPVFTKEQQAYIDNLIKELKDKETQKDAAATNNKSNQPSIAVDGNSKTKDESQTGESVQQSSENSLRNAPEDTVKTEKSDETVSSDKDDVGIPEELGDDEYAAAIAAEEEAENMDISTGMAAAKPSESKEPGRWHTPEMMEKEAYRAYSKLLIYRINLQEIYPELPWVSKETGFPRDLTGNQFDAKTSLMLAMHTEKEGYTLPVYLDAKTASQWHLSVRDDAQSFPVVGKKGVRWMYNIDDTNFRELYPRKFEELSQQDDADKNRLDNRAVSLGNLANNGQWLSPVKYDGEKDLASYDWKNNEIHVGDPKNYDDDNDFYRDLTIGMAANTRRLYQNSGNFDDYIREDLISHLTSAMISQTFRFNSNSPDISHFWKDKLKNDPDYTKNVLSSAEKSTGIIYQRFENVSRGYKSKDSDNLDYRTLTPGGGDEDGNDIPDELENYAAEKKQGANESEQEGQDEPYQPHRRR